MQKAIPYPLKKGGCWKKYVVHPSQPKNSKMPFPLEKTFEKNFSTEATKHQRYAGGAKIVATGYPEGRNDKRKVSVETSEMLKNDDTFASKPATSWPSKY